MDSNENVAQKVPSVSMVVDGTKVNLFHAAASPDPAKPLQKSMADSIFSFGKSKCSDWYYAVAGDSVMIRTGKLTLKSRIHSAEGFTFIRVPRLGLLLVEGSFLCKPQSGELALIEKKFVRSKE